MRANHGRRLRPDFDARFERAYASRPTDSDFLALTETDRLGAQVLALSGSRPSLTWPESQRQAVFAHLRDLAELVGEQHSSFLVFFRGWEYIGAVAVRSADVLASAERFWEEGYEAFGLVTGDLSDWLYLDYTEPKQMLGSDEYELYGWGDFAARG